MEYQIPSVLDNNAVRNVIVTGRKYCNDAAQKYDA